MCDGIAVYELDGSDGLDGRFCGLWSTAGHWTDCADGRHNFFAKVRVASSNLVIRSKNHQVSGPSRAAELHFRWFRAHRMPIACPWLKCPWLTNRDRLIRSGRNPVDWHCLKTSERIIYVVLCLVELGGIEPP